LQNQAFTLPHYQYIKAEHGYIDDLLLQKLKLMKSLASLSGGENEGEDL